MLRRPFGGGHRGLVAGSAETRRLVMFHEMIHQTLTPKLYPLRNYVEEPGFVAIPQKAQQVRERYVDRLAR